MSGNDEVRLPGLDPLKRFEGLVYIGARKVDRQDEVANRPLLEEIADDEHAFSFIIQEVAEGPAGVSSEQTDDDAVANGGFESERFVDPTRRSGTIRVFDRSTGERTEKPGEDVTLEAARFAVLSRQERVRFL